MKLILSALLLAAAALPAAAEDVSATIIGMERDALTRSDKGDVTPFLQISAPDVVYQDPALDKPIRGLEALTAYYKTFPTGGTSHGEMSNAVVQAYGDVAVLSFHYVVHQENKVVREWNCTEVYRKTDSNWRIVNTHWSLTKPLLQKLD
jgi:hypothetical protein